MKITDLTTKIGYLCSEGGQGAVYSVRGAPIGEDQDGQAKTEEELQWDDQDSQSEQTEESQSEAD